MSIGGDAGLSLNRSYISTSADGLSPGWLLDTFSIVKIEPFPTHPDLPPPTDHFRRWIYHVVLGSQSFAFTGGGKNAQGSAVPVGTYYPAADNGTSLVYTGTNQDGYLTFTNSDGTVVNFTGWVNGKVANLTKPDGTRLEYTYGGGTTIISNRGYALIVEGKTKACVVNLAYTYIAPGVSATCPADAQTVTYGYTQATFLPSVQLLTSAAKAGRVMTYGYVGADHLGCIKELGQTACKISNEYGICPEDPYDPSTRFSRRYRDPVLSQQTATGETFSYSYAGGDYLQMCDYTNQYSNQANTWQFTDGDTIETSGGGAQTRVYTTTGGLPYLIRDPLGRESSALYTSSQRLETELTQLLWSRQPEGNEVHFDQDSRGNITSKTEKAKPGSSLDDVVTSATYPPTCDNPKTCNKPMSVTDGRGGTTSYTYSADHGGVLTETGPIVGGVSPVKRYGYAQFYAWLKTAGGGYAPAGTPVWLPTEERTCRTTVTEENACRGGASDETIVSYEYQLGNASTPSNLLLRGKVVTADGTSLRTCYGYDREGNRIWETSPRAGLASCN